MFTCLSTHTYVPSIDQVLDTNLQWNKFYNINLHSPKPNQLHVYAFLDTLDAPMIKQLALCSLQNGAESMDYVHSLMLRMYDDTDEKENPLYHFQQQNQEPVQYFTFSYQMFNFIYKRLQQLIQC